MTTGGWLIMLFSVVGVSALFVTCVVKVLKGGNKEHMHGLEQEPPDVEK
ncbi:hypothetical protein N9B94_04340 [Verrucomicrobia bacterium]|nr:hypothetical protein [Verrucomicrobiota bacterium]